MKTKNLKLDKQLYEFYLEHCIDESKNEIPLSYLEWKINYGEEEEREIILKQL